MQILTWEEMLASIKKDESKINSLYKDIGALRYSLAGEAEEYQEIGADLDDLHGGDWMPVSMIMKLRLLEWVRFGTVAGVPADGSVESFHRID